MLAIPLSVAALASGALTIRAQLVDRRSQVYVFKPMATLLLVLIAALAPTEAVLKAGMVAGLALSLAGDVFLMLPQKYFVWGLASFLAAHLCYIAVFAISLGGSPAWWLYLPFGAHGLGMYLLLAPRVGSLRLPVLVYALAITAMAWLAVTRALRTPSPSATRAAVGAVLFLASDTALSVERFVRRFHWSPLLILSTYYTGQWLLALSLYP